jgi:Lon protease-like protein
MPELVSQGFPLFPLGIVALPHESVPLHIFEQRYRTMIERCLQAEPGTTEREFGILWLSEQELKPIGCACEVERVLERMDDGRLNILARGTRPFRLLERQDDLPYPAGVVEFLSEPEEQPDTGAGDAARALYRELVLDATDRGGDRADGADRAGAGAGAFEREGQVRLARPRAQAVPAAQSSTTFGRRPAASHSYVN